jgi:hypothetical protein
MEDEYITRIERKKATVNTFFTKNPEWNEFKSNLKIEDL